MISYEAHLHRESHGIRNFHGQILHWLHQEGIRLYQLFGLACVLGVKSITGGKHQFNTSPDECVTAYRF
jgi:hypothetical protein